MKLFAATAEGSKRVNRRVLRPGRHNMAKGALPPEDAAVSLVRVFSSSSVVLTCLSQALRLTEAIRQRATQTSTPDRQSADRS